jgi:phenylpropionate dioxygenase-like ring-hydroxylating dioxygenase large terminal subunit
MTWRRVVPLFRIRPGSVVPVELDDPDRGGEFGRDLVVWWPEAGDPVVSDARCPHQWSHLGYEGVVDGDELVCASHLWRFDESGRGTKSNLGGRRDPKSDLVCFPTRVVDGWVEADC